MTSSRLVGPGSEHLTFVLASANAHKVAEIEAVLRIASPSIVLLARPNEVPDVVENAGSLVGNARLKAVALRDFTGVSAIADDTGLFVDALDGAPGVEAAYFGGPNATYAENRAMMLAELFRVGASGPGERRARFVSVAFLAWADGTEDSWEGVSEGSIAMVEQGSDGFGYDPIFLPSEGNGLSFSQVGPAAKNEMSHRARAFRAMAADLATRLATKRAYQPPIGRAPFRPPTHSG